MATSGWCTWRSHPIACSPRTASGPGRYRNGSSSDSWTAGKCRTVRRPIRSNTSSSNRPPAWTCPPERNPDTMHHTPPRRRRPLVHRPFIFSWVLAASAVAAPEPAPTPVKGPTPDQIRQAIEDLASPRFAVREKASKVLWEAGKAAEETLRAAARSKDEETANRAKGILEKFDWGLYPDTPPEAVRLIEKFRGGDPETRHQAVGELMRLKPARFDLLRKVIAQEQDEKARREMYDGMALQSREAVPQLLVDGGFGEAAELLEICVSPSNRDSLGDYAAYQHQLGRLPEAIARMEALRKRPADAQRATEALVYLYRVQKNWAAARKAADDSKNPDLQTDLAWEAGDWKR